MAKVDSSVPRYRYENIEIVDVYDADTITVRVELGFKVTTLEKFRLARINAFEVRGIEKQKGVEARNWLENTLANAKEKKQKIWIETFKDATEKFGRYLAELYVGSKNINDELVKLKHARYQEY